MKLNKFFALGFAALALFACKDPNNNAELKLDKTSAQVEVGKTVTITANIAVDSWETSDATVATVAGGVVTGVKEGTAIITATAGTDSKTCVVKVVKEGQQQQGGKAAEVKGSKFWPIFMDAVTADANAAKMAGDFRVDGTYKHCYIPWEGANYEANENPSGLNAAGNTEGYFAEVVTAGGSWAGGGIAIDPSEFADQAVALLDDVVANPDDYYLHISIKSTDQASHCFYVFACEGAKFVLGSKSVYDGPVYSEFTRNGSWQEFDIPMSQYANALAGVKGTFKGTNIFVVLTEYIPGAQINLDLVYFYKK